MSEFKVGDKVKVMRHPSGDNTKYSFREDFQNAWIPCLMDDAVGKIFTIIAIGSDGVLFKTHSYGFPPDSLVDPGVREVQLCIDETLWSSLNAIATLRKTTIEELCEEVLKEFKQ